MQFSDPHFDGRPPQMGGPTGRVQTVGRFEKVTKSRSLDRSKNRSAESNVHGISSSRDNTEVYDYQNGSLHHARRPQNYQERRVEQGSSQIHDQITGAQGGDGPDNLSGLQQ